METNKRTKRINNQIKDILASTNYLTYEHDQLNCLEPWQYYEPEDLSNKDRFDLDIEAYKKTFFKSAHDIGDCKFNETYLLERLIKNLKSAKHPVFFEYRRYLKNKLKQFRKK